jgi:ASC-1-like (ASCH) protein
MKLTAIPFEKIRNGSKVIESRLYDEKRQTINLGDEILFSQSDDDTQTVNTKVIGILRYPSFQQLFADHDLKLFGGTSADELLKEIKQFYSDEDEMKYGVVGVRLENSSLKCNCRNIRWYEKQQRIQAFNRT